MSGFFRLHITSEVDHLSLRDARRFSGLGTDAQTATCQLLVNEFCPERVNIPVAGRDHSRRLSAEIVLVRNRIRKTVLSLCRDYDSCTVTEQSGFEVFPSEPPELGQSNKCGCEWTTSGVDKMRRVSSGQHEGLPEREFIAGLKMIPKEWNLWR